MLFHFLNLYVEKKTLAKDVACTMIFNTASTMTNSSLNSRNRLFSCSGIRLFIGFLVFHLIKISFVIPEACAIIYNTASLANKFMKRRNKKIKNIVYVAAHASTFFFYLQRRSTKPKICRLTFTTASSIPKISIFHFFFNIDFLFRCCINLNNGEAVLNIIAQASGFTKLIFIPAENDQSPV